MSNKPWKLFPLRLPENYHGKPRTLRKLSQIQHQKSQQRDNPQFVQMRIGHWQLRRLDKDVQRQRSQFIVHPTKPSQDTPNWFKNTMHYFDRSHYNQRNRGKIVSHADGFNKTRQQGFKNSSFMSESRRIWREPSVTQKVNNRDPSLSGTRWMPMRQQVTGKVGSVDSRDYSIRKPHLKVGTRQVDNFINTYSVA